MPLIQGDGLFEQSFAQGRVFYLNSLYPSSIWNLMPLATRLRGPLQLDALRAALLAIEERHEPLRTTFEHHDEVDVQVVHPFVPKQLRVVEVSEGSLVQALYQEQTTPFNLESDAGWRLAVFRLNEEDHVLSIVMHCIVADDWSIHVLRRELATFYAAVVRGQNPLAQARPLVTHYRDFTVGQREEAQIAEHQRQLEYWRKQLDGSQPAELLCDKPRPAVPSGKALVHEVVIEGALYRTLQQFCKMQQVTPFAVLFAAFRAVQYRLTGAEDATIGTPIANRNRQELEDLIGLFVNILCIRSYCEDETFGSLVRQVQDTMAAAAINQDIPFEKLVAELRPGARDLSRHPLVQIIFAVHSRANINKFNLEGVWAETVRGIETTRFDLEFHFYEEEEGNRISGTVRFSDDLFDVTSIQSMTSVFFEILGRGLREPSSPVATILLTDGLSALTDMGLIHPKRTNYPRNSSVPEIFQKQAAICGDAIAVKDVSTQLTYAELDRRSDQLAYWLRQWKFAPESTVGILAPRSCEAVVAILGILKANLAYVPFDINAPSGRFETILSTMQGSTLVLLGEAVPAPITRLEKIEFVTISEACSKGAAALQEAEDDATTALPVVAPTAKSLAYVMFTSGSTGQPKGVMIEHRGIVRLVKDTNVISPSQASGRVAHISNLAFDAATWEIYAPLLNGGTVVCIDHMTVLDVSSLDRVLKHEVVQSAMFTPALMKECLASFPKIFTGLRTLFIAGDRLHPHDSSELLRLFHGDLINAYGPTENTTFSTIYRIYESEINNNGVPIGRAIHNSGAIVMDPQQRLVPLGVMGELVVTGDGLARGYTNPALDQDRFVQVSIHRESIKAYRTGDRVRYRPSDGQLEFFGRMDQQVKIRGHRIELAEVEQAILRDKSVTEAVVLAREVNDQEKDLVGFITIRVNEFESKLNNKHANGKDTGEGGQVATWASLFNTSTYANIDTIDTADLGRDFMGWVSMYNGEPIDRGEMNEWLDDTIYAIQSGGKAVNVFEIGTGTGMILFSLIDKVQSYAGLDPSESAATFIIKMAKSRPGLAEKVDVRVGTAADIGQLNIPNSPELVIINSVAQYFPSMEYMFTVVQSILQLESVERIFFGDVRSYALYRDFCTTKALHILGVSASQEGVQRQLTSMEESEEEFLVDPAFFTSLVDRLPDLVEHVEILPKRMKATNELSCYRFAAVIHVKGRGRQPRLIHDIPEDAWINFQDAQLDRVTLLDLLQGSSNSSIMAVSHIPYSKTIFERYIVDSLNDEVVPMDWLGSIRESAHRTPSLSAYDIVEVAQEAGFRVEISWARQHSLRGGLDAIFHRIEDQRPLFRFPTDHHGRPTESLTNKPLRRQQMQEVEAHLRTGLQTTLPSYMVPARIKVLDKMPLNANGKVDRRALSRLQLELAPSQGHRIVIPARNNIERVLCEEFTHILHLEVGISDNFFDLGGHSLMATRVVSRINRRVQASITVKDVFTYPVITDLAQKVGRSLGTTQYIPIPRITGDGPFEQSFAQSRLWFIDGLFPASTWYLVPFATRIRGPLQLDALCTALLAIEERHEPLRTTFEHRNDVDVQVVHPFIPKQLRVVNLADDGLKGLAPALHQEHTTPFNLESEAGWRPAVFRLGEEDYVLSIVMHHIICDGWSVDVLQRELATFYSAAIRGQDPLAQVHSLPVQYRDFAIWQRQEAQRGNYNRQLDYWKKQLDASQPAELFCDKPRPAVPSGKALIHQVVIEGALHRELSQFCKRQQATPFAVLLAAFRATHYRLTGAEDATIGTPIANRNRQEVEDMVGFFVNMQCIRIYYEDESFESLVRQVQDTTAAAAANQDVPFEKLVAELRPGARDLSRHPLVQIVFVVHSQKNFGRFHLEGLRTEPIKDLETTRFDLEFHLFEEEGNRMRGTIIFSEDLFNSVSIQSMASVFFEILQCGLQEPSSPVATIPLLNGISTLTDMGLTRIKRTNYPRDASIPDLFRQQVAIHGDTVAVKDAFAQLTYAELDRQSDHLAYWLAQQEFSPESTIGVLAPRSCEAIVAIFGILKANLAYVPFDVNVPHARLRYILSAMQGRKLVLLGTGIAVPVIGVKDVQFITISGGQSKGAAALPDPTITAPSATATSLAYVMFTSGSTGQPKGVMIEHRGIVRLVKDTNLMSRSQVSGRVAHLSNLAFDAATWEIYAALLNGGTLVCIDSMTVLDLPALSGIFSKERIEAALFSAALLTSIVYESPAILGGLKLLLVGGDKISPKVTIQARRLIKGTFLNAYGPTENSCVSTFFNIHSGDCGINGPPIGQAVSNSAAFVMDSQQRLVPLGVMGELVVAGDGLARGYTDPALDLGRFVQVSINGESIKVYRTGDRVRYRPIDGQLEFLGRMDQQIKVRGHRIEVAEVEQALLQDRSVIEAVVLAREANDGEKELISFVTVRTDDFSSQIQYEQVNPKGTGDNGQVATWANRFDSGTYADINIIDTTELGRDFLGWTSMYNGELIDRGEMNEWLDDTINAIQSGGKAVNVFEIGTGTGMILFSLVDKVQSYTGLDPSESATTFIMKMAKSRPGLAEKVDVRVGTAADVDQLSIPNSPELVVINSVAQYFPSAEYLFAVIKSLLQLESVERLFFGDIRSYALYREFGTTKALHVLGPSATRVGVRRQLASIEKAEEELLVDPAFFTSLVDRLPDLVEHVEILPKRMKATNELSCYRFAAVIHVKGRGRQPRLIHDIPEDAWINFQDAQLDRATLLNLLQGSSNSSIVAVSHIPYSKTIFERYLVESLNSEVEEGPIMDRADWLTSIRDYAHSFPALSTLDIVELAQEAGFEVELSWARQYSLRGGLDVIFHRVEGQRPLFRFPIDYAGRTEESFTNKPLRPHEAQEVEAQEVEAHLRAELQATLPSYMVPARVKVLDKMPVNPNGKVDRRALARLQIETAPNQGPHIVIPGRNNTERILCEEFTYVLGIEVGISDNFFNLGGHSLMATRLVSRINRRLHASIKVRDVFTYPVVADLAAEVSRSLGTTKYVPIPRVLDNRPFEQSFAQGRLYFLDHLYPSSTWYLIPIATRLRGPLQLDALRAALLAIEERHEPLRTTFEHRDEVDVQVVHPFIPKPLRVVDIIEGDLVQTLHHEQMTPFDLRSEPGWRPTVFRLGEEDHVLSIVMHHIISDGWSVGVLHRELDVFYTAAVRGQDPLTQVRPLPIQYRDFAVWQREEAQITEYDLQLDYWKKQLDGSQPAELLCDKPRPVAPSGKAQAYELIIEGAFYLDLLQFCKTHQATPFSVLFAAFRATHYRLTGAEDATIGTPVANRNRQELEDLIGFFVNTQCIRTYCKDETFQDLVQQVQDVTAAAAANQDIPFERLVAELRPGARDLSRHPLVQIIFAVHSQESRFHLEGVQAEPIEEIPTSRLDLEFHFVHEEGNRMHGTVVFSDDLFDAVTIQSMTSVFFEILRRGLQEPSSPVATILLTDGISALDKMGLMRIQRTNYPRDASIPDVFRQQAAINGVVIAVKDASAQLTYAELDRRSDQLAYWLVQREFAPESTIGVLASRSCEAIVAIIGILKANLAYVPLDVNAPSGRFETILSVMQGSKVVLLGAGITAPVIRLKDVEFITIDEAQTRGATALQDTAIYKSLLAPTATSLAYVMFTSGSTGQPKGVMIEHRGIIRLVKDTNLLSPSQVRGRVAHVSNLAFDASTLEIYAALLNGGTLVCIDNTTLLDTYTFGDIFLKEDIEAAVFSPALLKLVLYNSPTVLSRLKLLIIGGEKMSPKVTSQAQRLIKGTFINSYGPTENTTASTVFHIDSRDYSINGPPIGRAITNSGAFVMDVQQRLVPLGVIGELVVTGDGLARGYTDPVLDQDRFVRISINGESVRAYRTGDRVRCRATDGQLEFFERMDQQVKIRGHRLELADVEKALLRDESVTEAVVLVKEVDDQENELIGFITISSARQDRVEQYLPGTDNLATTQDIILATIFGQLRAALPAYMVPARITVMDKMPLNTNGKVDRQALAQMAVEMAINKIARTIVPPQNEVQRVLCEEFTHILGVEVGIADNFFELGGHSLMALRVISRINQRLNINATVKDVFIYPLVADLAEKVSQSVGAIRYTPISRIRGDGPFEQSFAQSRLFFIDRLYPLSTWYLMPLATRLRGPLQLDALRAALLAIEERHEPLRTTFQHYDGKDLQIIHPFTPKSLRVVEVTEDGPDGLVQALHREQTTTFDLETEPGWRTAVFRLGEEDYVLSIVMHHIISDGWSVGVLQRELDVFYAAAVRGQNPLAQVRPLPIQYRDFAMWQRQEAQATEHQRQLEYWKKQLEGSQPAELLCDKPRPAVPSGKAQVHEVMIEGVLIRELREFCRTQKVTPFVVLFAAFRAAHFRLTGVEDATIGTPIANRNRQEIEDLTGFFVNTQCIRTYCENETFGDLVRQVQDTTAAAAANQDVPFEKLVAELQPGARDLTRNPLVQIMFALHSQENIGRFHLVGLQAETVEEVITSRFDLEFHFFEEGNRLRGTIIFSDDLFNAVTIQSMASVFFEIFRRGIQDHLSPISTMPLTDGLSALADMGLTRIVRTDYPRDASVPDVFRRQVTICGDKIAVKDDSTQLTYAELDRRSDQLACWLVQREFTPERTIVVLAPRSCEAIVAIFGILKSNLAYVPLDVNVPPARLETILSAIQGSKLVLLGAGVAAPVLRLDDVEFITIDEAQSKGALALEDTTNKVLPAPTATSLAYVMFTSGSTGQPKGVMIEHRSIVRLVKETNVTSSSQASGRVAHISNLAFDAATWEIYAPLLNGGTVVCINYMTVLNVHALGDVFLKEDINASFMTTALLKSVLYNSPATFNTLKVLLVGGEKMAVKVASKAQKLLSGVICHVYGPTENTTFSTIFPMNIKERNVNGAPIGRAINNSGVYVMNPQQRLVPLGVMGELVLTGDGLARGYLDPALNQDRFVQLSIDGESVKAYRTGDRVRYRPSDGQLEFFGRMDQQVKIRGHRIELAEVEQAILRDKSVTEAVVLAREVNDQEKDLVGFVTIRVNEFESELDDKHANGKDTGEGGQVATWASLFNTSTYANINTIDTADLGRDFMGWVSMYNGEPIDRGEMNEWLDDTIYAIQSGGKAVNVFEIGTGTGMILFSLIDRVQSYAGLDPSESAAAFITKMTKSRLGLAEKVDIRVGTAADIGQLSVLNSPELVIINSVAQYFPSVEYMFTVVQSILQLESVERIFFGDVRSYALYRDFCTTKALHILGVSASPEGVQRQLTSMEESEEEFLVDPAFFTSLVDRLPDLVEHVEILPKRMKATNELSCYRFAAIIHVKGRGGLSRPTYKVAEDAWVNFQAAKLSRTGLLSLLQGSSSSSIVAVANIPYSKTILERHIVDSLNDEVVPMDWLGSIRESAHRTPSLSAYDIVEVAQEAGFRVEISWARQHSLRGGLDAIFHRIEDQRPLFWFPTDHHGRPTESFTNKPLRRQQMQEVEAHLRTGLQATLPSYMVPARIKVLDKMPINANGKVDRQALARMAVGSAMNKTARTIVPPQNDIQRMLCEEFAHILGVEVGISDNFFDLGGHSLMALRLLWRVNTNSDFKITVQDLYLKPTPSALAFQIASRRDKPVAAEETHLYMEHHPRENSSVTLVLIHGFWGSGRIFSELLSLLDHSLDVITVHDPFFGSPDGPKTIHERAVFYLSGLRAHLDPNRPIMLGGYSLGGLVAFQMASIWRQWFPNDIVSLVLLDPGSFETVNIQELDPTSYDQEIEYALRLYGHDQKPYILQHWEKLGQLLISLTPKPEYHQAGLYISSHDAVSSGTAAWWSMNYPQLDVAHIDSTHHTLLDKPFVQQLGYVMNKHCSKMANYQISQANLHP